jgi:hypothetical protein
MQKQADETPDMLDLPIIYDEHPIQELIINECIVEVAEAYKVDPLLLRAIREHERGDVGKKNLNTDGSWDLGPFQINTIHLPELAREFGLTEHDLMYDPCKNAAVAGWHLRNKINENKGNVWKGVAWYHSKTPSLGNRYKQLIVGMYKRLMIKAERLRVRIADTGSY